jgi:hypothetical protein
MLLSIIDGLVDDPTNRAASLATAYITIVEKNVIEPVGVNSVDAKPPIAGPQATKRYGDNTAWMGQDD